MTLSLFSTTAHIVTWRSGGHMIDQYVCTCGWKSQPYFDLAEAAKAEADQHLKDVLDSPPPEN